MKSILSLFFIILILQGLKAQTKYSIHGVVTDVKGDPLVGANIIVKELTRGTVTNDLGKYSLDLPAGTYNLNIVYLGYEEKHTVIKLNSTQSLNFKLRESTELIESVEVSAEAPDKNVTKNEMSVNKLEMKQVQKLPVVFGEGDIIKTLQLLPGVISSGEASGGFHVRGGNVDQNLILIDRAQVYNASHAVGFFSVFNSNIIEDVKLFKGGISPEYGGRLSSVLDIKTIEPDMQKYHGSASLGLISSKALIQGPVIPNKLSFYIGGRRTYADLFLPFAKDSLAKESNIYFYDVNAKLKAVLGQNDRIYFSAYYGRDVVKFGSFIHQKYGNEAYSLHWNHFFSNSFYMNNYLTLTKYNYDLKYTQKEDWARIVTDILDVSAKTLFTYSINQSNTLKFGAEATKHNFNPGHLTGFQAETDFDYDIDNNYSWEYGLFVNNEQNITPRFSLIYGLRYSLFHNIGKGTSYTFDTSNPEDYIPVDSTYFSSGEIFNVVPNGIEPRLSFRYMLNETSSVKGSYNRMSQYIQLASNSTASLPLEYWFSASPNIKPQVVDQLAVGYFKNFKDNMFEVSVEAFYKDIKNSIDFKDHANLILNSFYEGQLRIGNSWAYGGEILVKKQKGALTGWLSYTYSRVFKKIPEINKGKTYPAAHDKPHDFALVLSYDVNERLILSGNWVYTSAPPRTIPKQRWEYNGMLAPYYGNRNSVRIFPYHRLDLAVTYKLNKTKKNWEHNINFSIYNAYARHNPIMISFAQDEDDKTKTKATGTYLYSFVPSFSYTISF
jgi:hypothetical protein